MTATEKQIENLRPAKKGEVRNPNGRPKKFVSTVLENLKEQGYTNIKRSQIVDIYETLLSLSEADLNKMVTESDTPMIYRIVGKAMLSKRGFDIIERMIDRTQGKAVQRNEITGADGSAIPIALVEFIGGDNENQNTIS